MRGGGCCSPLRRCGDTVSASDLAVVAALVFAWGALSARLERFDVTAPIVFAAAGLVLTHGPLAALGIAPDPEAVKVLAEFTLVLVLFSDASRVGEASRWCRSWRRPGRWVSLLVWLAFGAVAIAPALEALTWQLVVYAVLSLTVIRMAPVALALAGAGLGRRAVAFI